MTLTSAFPEAPAGLDAQALVQWAADTFGDFAARVGAERLLLPTTEEKA